MGVIAEALMVAAKTDIASALRLCHGARCKGLLFTILATGSCILYNTPVNSYAPREILPRLEQALLWISRGKAYEQIFDSRTAYGRKFA